MFDPDKYDKEKARKKYGAGLIENLVQTAAAELKAHQMGAVAGETVLLKENGACRWVRVVHAGTVRIVHGKQVQEITVQACDQYGRQKPRRVTLGSNAVIEWVA